MPMGALEKSIKNLLMVKLSDTLDAEGITEEGVGVPPEAFIERWGGIAEEREEREERGVESEMLGLASGVDAEAYDEEYADRGQAGLGKLLRKSRKRKLPKRIALTASALAAKRLTALKPVGIKPPTPGAAPSPSGWKWGALMQSFYPVSSPGFRPPLPYKSHGVSGLGALRLGTGLTRFLVPTGLPRQGTVLRAVAPSALPPTPAAAVVGEVFKPLAEKLAATGGGVVTKTEVMKAAEPEMERMARQMAEGVRSATTGMKKAAKAGDFGREAREQALTYTERAEGVRRLKQDLPAEDTDDPRAFQDADSFYVYPETDWDNLVLRTVSADEPAGAAAAKAAAVEGTRRAMTELKATGDPEKVAEALDKMNLNAPPPGETPKTAGEAARVIITEKMAERGVAIPRRRRRRVW